MSAISQLRILIHVVPITTNSINHDVTDANMCNACKENNFTTCNVPEKKIKPTQSGIKKSIFYVNSALNKRPTIEAYFRFFFVRSPLIVTSVIKSAATTQCDVEQVRL